MGQKVLATSYTQTLTKGSTQKLSFKPLLSTRGHLVGGSLKNKYRISPQHVQNACSTRIQKRGFYQWCVSQLERCQISDGSASQRSLLNRQASPWNLKDVMNQNQMSRVDVIDYTSFSFRQKLIADLYSSRYKSHSD